MIARSRALWVLVIASVLLYVLAVLRTSWLSDDAYISLRMVDNLVHGRGLTWNPGERVLVGTHPLWIMLLTPFMALSGEEFYATLAVCWACSLLSALLLVRLSAAPVNAALACGVLALSRSVVDYSTSGLENPLTWLISLGFVTLLSREARGPRDLLGLSLLGALGMVNRWDAVLLFAPAIGLELWRWRGRAAIGYVALGGLPLVLWLLFSTFYFGFPFPNTAYAKLGTGLDGARLLEQGLAYYRWTLQNDPLTFVALIGAAVLTLRGPRRLWPLVAGAGLYLLYTLKIGGDFMGGRFFNAPLMLLLGAAVLRPAPGRPALAVTALAILGLGLPLGGRAVFASYRDAEAYAAEGTARGAELVDEGVADERLWHSDQHALFSPGRRERAERPAGPQGRPQIGVRGMIGRSGFVGSVNLHLIDVCALSDPLLARLPAAGFERLRVGHYFRVLPRGYVETLETGEDHFEDRAVADYYARLSLVTRGELLDPARLAEIWRFNTGQNGLDIDRELYRNPPSERITLKELRAAKRQEGGYRFWPTGVEIDLGRKQRSPSVEIELAARFDYIVQFRREDSVLGKVKVKGGPGKPDELLTHTIVTPDRAPRGFDNLFIKPARLDNDQRHIVGNLTLAPAPPPGPGDEPEAEASAAEASAAEAASAADQGQTE